MSGTRTFAALAGLALLAGALASSCGKNPTSPPSEPVLSGTVLDVNGFAVPNARVEISYPFASPAPLARLVPERGGAHGLPPGPADIAPVTTVRYFEVTNNPCSLGTVNVLLGLPADAQVVMGVITRDGIPVRTLVNQTLPAGAHAVTWDGRDNSTNPVPADVYRVTVAETQGDSTFDYSQDVLWNSSDPNQANNLTADGDGKFFIAFSQLPVGLTLHAVSSTGADLGDFKVGHLIRVSATGPVVGGPITTASVAFTYLGRSQAVVVQLP